MGKVEWFFFVPPPLISKTNMVTGKKGTGMYMGTLQGVFDAANSLLATSQVYNSLEDIFSGILHLHHGRDSVIRISVKHGRGENRWKGWLPDLDALIHGTTEGADGPLILKSCVLKALVTNTSFVNHLIRAGYLKVADRRKREIYFSQVDVLCLVGLKEALVRKYKNKYRNKYFLNELRNRKKAGLL